MFESARFPHSLECAALFLNKASTGLIEEFIFLYKACTGLKQGPFPVRPGALFKAGLYLLHYAALNRDLYCSLFSVTTPTVAALHHRRA